VGDGTHGSRGAATRVRFRPQPVDRPAGGGRRSPGRLPDQGTVVRCAAHGNRPG